MALHKRLRKAPLDVPLFPHEVPDNAEVVRIAAAAVDEELAEHAIALAERRAILNPTVRSCAAAAAHARGIWFESIPDLENASQLYREGPRPLAYASALEDLGRARVAAGGDTALAIDSFDEALSITTRTGAEWESARLRGRLRRLGVHRGLLGSERPKSGWASLTDPEINVATLAADGRTNRQIADSLFVSPHTVNMDLRHIFGKLRDQLASPADTLCDRTDVLRAARSRAPGIDASWDRHVTQYREVSRGLRLLQSVAI